MPPPPYTAPSGPTIVMIDYVQAPPPMVVTTQSTVVVMAPPVYKDYLTWSILNMIFCCLPLGIVALIFSIQTRDAIYRQDSLAAANNSRSAFVWNMVAFGLGLCINSAWSGYVTYYNVAG